ncbi:MAG: acyl carrier protein [Clostridia bacterium]|nr:acyl carrier protein [Clostridia bacterium]
MSNFEKVKELLVENLGVAEEKITLESEIIKDLGADSLDLVEMLLSMEENFGITISDDQTENIKTVKDIVDIIENN